MRVPISSSRIRSARGTSSNRLAWDAVFAQLVDVRTANESAEKRVQLSGVSLISGIGGPIGPEVDGAGLDVGQQVPVLVRHAGWDQAALQTLEGQRHGRPPRHRRL